MAVTLVGVPGAATTTTGAVPTAAYGQAPTPGNLLVAVLLEASTTSTGAVATSLTSGTGWAQMLGDQGLVGITNDRCVVGVWSKFAGASEPAPGFQIGGSTTINGVCVIYELAGALNTLDTSGLFQPGSTATTVASVTVTASAAVSQAGGFAIAGYCLSQTSASTYAFSESPFTRDYDNGTTSSRNHVVCGHQANPALVAVSDAISFTSTSVQRLAEMIVIPPAPPAILPQQTRHRFPGLFTRITHRPSGAVYR